MQVWHYPDLGMHVTLWDRSLRQSYEFPYSDRVDTDARPDPALLEGRPDLVALGGGHGVFRAMPPGARPMDVRGAISRFPLPDGARVLAHVFAVGEPSDSLWGSWAIVTGDGRVVARESHMLSISACDPARRQVADFAANVPPGDYRVDLAVRGSQRRRGVAHLSAHVGTVPERLTMSDLVLLCGSQPVAVGPEGVRIEPSAEKRVSAGGTVTVYYELEHLATGADGLARFAYTYTVRPVTGREGDDRVPAAVFEATREEENVGAHRRQMVSVPVGSLAPGAYQLRLEVRDLVSGVAVADAVEFVKDGAEAPAR